ncbi:fasciclin domain-containing protein [Salegentibacter sp. F188]|uniref:Fasciclin domain-containing protein n=1 Tax=Autumnicola patrickiae TaxID=3075591 RepID=A0ABU3DXL4_9FLAO|nr:fasciclin domain-containing protein [Salegentibacter sp. F188]MDT0688443.1 fasciclin domain-containing protein [Salegentibacter sp. F188]
MKTISLKAILVATITILGTSFYGCGGASSTGGMSDGNYEQGRTTNTLGELPYPAADMDYDNLFGNADSEDHDITTLIGMNENFSTFAALAKMSNLDMKLDRTGPVTMFIPTNEAFQEMPLEQFNMLTDPDNRAQLGRFIQRHILPNKVSSVDFNSSQAIETSSEEEIVIDTEANGGVITIGGAQIIKSDIDASNGVIHVVNSIVQTSRDVFTD